MAKHSYAAAERFILSREFFGMKLGLENITEFLASVGCPQNRYRTVHIAGTNGKGSVAAMLASVLQHAGYKTGLFTSPHLVDLRERIRVNGRKIPKPSVQAFINAYRQVLSKRKLSFFEVVTALALYHFWKVGVDIAVIETGLGGRLDATNVLTPLATVVTDISYDHVEILGSSLEKIAWEKAGIIKPATPHVIGIIPPEARRVMTTQCRQRKAPLVALRKNEFHIDRKAMTLDFSSNGFSCHEVTPSLYGVHQLKNAALALKVVSVLRENGVTIPNSAVREGLARTTWHGRFQVVKRRGKPTLVFDVCHNASGVKAFVESFRTRFPGRKTHIITGFVKRKPHQQMFDMLATIAEDFALVPLNTKRSTDLEELWRQITWPPLPVTRFPSLSSAYRSLLKTCPPDDTISIVGSHFLVGEFFKKYGWA